jgi:dUTP pyrophosphatase
LQKKSNHGYFFKIMKLGITKIRDSAVIPGYASTQAAAFDLTAAIDVMVPPQTWERVPTGLIFHIPTDHVLHIFARSSTFPKLGLFLSNGVGVIDPDYCGPQDELCILVYNPGATPVQIQSGTRIAQGIIYPRPRIEFEEIICDTSSSRGGIGSTGGYETCNPQSDMPSS